MYRRDIALIQVRDALTWIQTQCIVAPALGLTDVLKHSESFFCRFLSRMYGLNLQVLDYVHFNFPAIDLGDTSATQCYQITATGKSRKIQDTLTEFYRKGLYAIYRSLKILVIGEGRQDTYPSLDIPSSILFDPAKDILGIKELAREVQRKDIGLLLDLAAICVEEVLLPPRQLVATVHGAPQDEPVDDGRVTAQVNDESALALTQMSLFFPNIMPHEGDRNDSVRWRLNRLALALPLLPKTFAERRSESELPNALRPRILVSLAERCFTAGNYLRAFQYQLFVALLGLFRVNLDVNDLIECMTRALYYLRRNQTVDLVLERTFLRRMADWLGAAFAAGWGEPRPEARSYLLSLEELASWLNERGHPEMALPVFDKHESILAVNKRAYRKWEITRLERQKAHMYENLLKLTKATYCLDVAVELSDASQNLIPIRQIRNVDLAVLAVKGGQKA